MTGPAGIRIETVDLLGLSLGSLLGEAYGGQRSGWQALKSKATLTLKLAA